MQPLTGVVKNYAWGSRTAIPELLGRESDAQPQAEYWLGAHAAGPASLDGSAVTLDVWLREHPEALGPACRATFGDRLPFLFKILAADGPLSLQAHPSADDAVAGFTRENNAGIPLDSPERSFKDPWPKPELVVALTPFEVLSGFRDPTQTLALFEALGVPSDILNPVIGPLRHRDGEQAALAEVFLDCLSPGDARGEALTEVVAAAVRHLPDGGELGRFARLAVLLDEHHPGDPSLLAALMLNHIDLAPGQGLRTAPGTLHAYLGGVGIEIMANSDNVLRGGLTSKHIDAPALVSCVDFTAIDEPIIEPQAAGDGAWSYSTPDPQFALWRVEPGPGITAVPGGGRARILWCAAGHLSLRADGGSALRLGPGQAFFLAADEDVVASGDGDGFLASSGI